MRILVTGATGFIGRVVADELAASGHRVLASARRPRPHDMPHDYIAWDLASDVAAPPDLADCDAVVHVAANVSPCGPDAGFQHVTVDGTSRLLRSIDPSARLVVIGSSSVYDPNVPHMDVTETEGPVAASRYLNAYARAKAEQERVVLAARPDAVILRPRAVWGPGDTTLLPRLLARIHRGVLVLPCGGCQPMSATHISSLAATVETALERPDVAGPINVADATPTTARTLVEALAASLRRSVRIVAVPAAVARLAASGTETLWRGARRTDEPAITRYAVAAFTQPCTLDLDRLHTDLAIRPDIDLAAAADGVAAYLSGSRARP